MNSKEARRVFVMEQVAGGGMTIYAAAVHLGISPRQVQRLKASLLESGTAGLAHGNRAKPSPRATPPEQKQRVIALAQGVYEGASLSHLSELLARHDDIVLSAKTLGRILADAGVPRTRTARPAKAHRTRPRRAREGDLLQIDASPFDWLEERGPRLSLHGAVDDATSRIVGLHFRPTEDTVGYLQVLWQVFTLHGLPLSVYSDRHTIFFSPKTDKLSVEEELAGVQVKLTNFGRVLETLGIGHIAARSPQAKGRIERLWGTLQKRLPIELRLAGITTAEQANAFLPGFLEQFHREFAISPDDTEPAWRAAPLPTALEEIVCLRERRKANNGSAFSFEGTLYQLCPNTRATGTPPALPLRPGSPVDVLRHLDGSLDALYQGHRYTLRPAGQRQTVPAVARETTQTDADSSPKAMPTVPGKPAKDHPWRNRGQFQRQQGTKR